jgi:hypothetical protein
MFCLDPDGRNILFQDIPKNLIITAMQTKGIQIEAHLKRKSFVNFNKSFIFPF